MKHRLWPLPRWAVWLAFMLNSGLMFWGLAQKPQVQWLILATVALCLVILKLPMRKDVQHMNNEAARSKYDHYCTFVRIQTAAEAVAVIVFGGDKGDGFTIQAQDEEFARTVLPDMLEMMAKEIRANAVKYPTSGDPL